MSIDVIDFRAHGGAPFALPCGQQSLGMSAQPLGERSN